MSPRWRAVPPSLSTDANLTFGGVVFGKATFGMRGRADIFLSYAWGRERRSSREDGGAAQPDDAARTYETQAIVSSLKTDLEHATRLSCWFDLERLGGGTNLDHAMEVSRLGSTMDPDEPQ